MKIVVYSEHRTITASSAKPEPGKTNTLTQFETFQGPPITSIKRAEEIHGKQKAFAGDAFQFLSKLNVDSKSFNIENQRPQIQPVLAIFQQYYRGIVLNQKAITPETLQQKQEAIFQSTHQMPDLTDSEKMGIEYALGLIRLFAYSLIESL